jgi:hypothetical protein
MTLYKADISGMIFSDDERGIISTAANSNKE